MLKKLNKVELVCKKVKDASFQLANSSNKDRNHALKLISNQLLKSIDKVITANRKDYAIAKKNKIPLHLLDKLLLDKERIENMTKDIINISKLEDPIGKELIKKIRPNGLKITKVSVPLGVIAVIFESRPNVACDVACLCIKSGNAVVLKGGKEAKNTTETIIKIIKKTLKKTSLDSNCVSSLQDYSRESVNHLLKMNQYIDVLVPRGGKELIRTVRAKSVIPIFSHLDGICHIYVDSDADIEKALKITDNSKTQRLGTCNTLETLLVCQSIAPLFLPKICSLLLKKKIEIRVCSITKKILLANQYNIEILANAYEKDWSTEYLSNIISIKTVSGIDEAISHITFYGSDHTDCIVTENHSKAMKFLNKVDSSSVMVNASTRFADGLQYGLGGEIGISTNKLHTRGPVGLEGLTTKKWVVFGDGHIRQ